MVWYILVHFGTFWKIIWVHSSGLEVAYDMLGAYYEYCVLWQWSIPKKWRGSSLYFPYQNDEKCICIPLTYSTDCFSHQDRDLEQAYIRCFCPWVISPSWNGKGTFHHPKINAGLSQIGSVFVAWNEGLLMDHGRINELNTKLEGSGGLFRIVLGERDTSCEGISVLTVEMHHRGIMRLGSPWILHNPIWCLITSAGLLPNSATM